jgi:hypothetical protein
MIFAKVLTKDFDIDENHVRLGSLLTVVDKISDDEKRRGSWWITPTEINRRYAQRCADDGDFELYTDEAPKMIFQFKTGSDNWVTLIDSETMQCYASKGFQTRTLYSIKTGT